VARGYAAAQVLTRISLTVDKNGDGTEYSKAIFEVVGELDEEKATQAMDYSEKIKSITRRNRQDVVEA
jgi:hypothetical protein